MELAAHDPRAGPIASTDGIAATFMLVLIFLFPPALFYLTDVVDSHADGLAIACGITLVTLALKGRSPAISPALAAIGVFIILHFLVAAQLQPLNLQRGFLSLGLMWLVFTTTTTFSAWFFRLDDQTVSRVVYLMLAAMFVIGAFNVLGIQPRGGLNVVKPTFPFTEPGHLGPILTPLLLFACARSNIIYRALLIAGALALAYLIQSLTLLIGAAMTAAIILPLRVMAVMAVGLAATVGLLDLDYFAERLDFTIHSRNLSSLAYLEGWEFIQSSLDRTSGWGIGFQQLGWVPFISPAADAIVRLTGRDFNLTDGTFVAAKFVSELGVFAIPAVILFIIVVGRSAWTLRRIAFRKIQRPAGDVLAMAFICGYSIDAFVRGVGLFTGTTFIVIAALLHFTARAREKAEPDAASVPALAHAERI